MDMEDSFTLREMYMKETGSKIKLMGMDSTHILTEHNMKVPGKKINNMEKEKQNVCST